MSGIRLRPLAAAVAAAGLLTGLSAAGTATAAAAAGTHGTAADAGTGAGAGAGAAAHTALQRAQASGERVEVTADRTEFDTVYANPDGATYTQEMSAVPVRVRAAGGGWTAPDATLVRHQDGTVGPRAAMVDLSFSGGGTAPMVSLGSGGKNLALTWPGTLPAPALDGDSATYPDVLPGVDLRLTASVEGYRQLLVVRTPQAAADQGLRKLTFGVRSAGLRVSPLAGGGLTGLDADGKQVFTAPPAQMWDSRGTGPTAQAKAEAQTPKASTPKAQTPDAQAPTTQAPKAQDVTPDPAGPPASALDGPAPGAGSRALPVSLSGSTLAVTPDAALLAQADTAAYPLYIDPNIGLANGTPEHTLLRSDGYTDYAWANGTNGEGDGKCGNWNGYLCGPGYVQKLYFQFAPGNLKGKHVLSATFRVNSPWAFQCSARQTDLVRTNNFTSGTTWAGRPKELDWMVDESFSAGRGSACDPDSPDAPIEFADNPAESDENLTPTVRDFAAGKFAKLTLELRAHDESDTSAWKRFKNDATLTVNYVATPVPPTSVGIKEGSGVACSTNAADPDVVGDPRPMLTAKPQVASGGSSAGAPAKLRAAFTVQSQSSSSGTWGMVTEPIRPSSPDFAGANSTVSTPSPITLTDGTHYRMAAATWAYEDNQTTHLGSYSTVTTTGWCYFTVDSTAPKAPTVTFGSPYTSCATNDCPAAGGPGVPGTFIFTAATGDKVTGFQYKLASGAWSTPISGTGPITATVTPKLTGTQQLQVRAKDDVGTGRWGAPAIVAFKVAAGADAVGRWHFDDSAPNSGGTTAADSATEAGSRHPATLRNAGAGWSSLGRRGAGDNSLWLNDTTNPDQQTGYADTSGPVVNTQDSFTVSAWVRLDDTDNYHTLLSQTSSDKSSFTLRYSPGVHRWVFLWTWPSGGQVTWLGASSTADEEPDVWTYVAASYDEGANTISLYVNGVPQGDPVALPAAAKSKASDGPLEFGRYNDPNKGAWTEYWDGRIDEVQVWQRALTPDEIALDAELLDADGKPAVENVAYWAPDPAATGTAPLDDAGSGYAHPLTFSNGASVADGAIVLDGQNDAGATPGPLVDEYGSFTVTTSVQVDQDAMLTKPDGYIGQVAGQRSADGSAWGLWYQITGRTTTLDDELNVITVPTTRWLFGRLNKDGSFSGAASAVDTGANTGDGSNGEGTARVTGVFDAQDGTATLYLGDTPEDTQAYSAVVAADRFSVGDAYVAGAWSHYLPARVAEIRVWSGAMSDPDQIDSVIGD